MRELEQRIKETEQKIAEVKKRWPFHSVKPAQVQELERLELEIEELQGELQKEKEKLQQDRP